MRAQNKTQGQAGPFQSGQRTGTFGTDLARSALADLALILISAVAEALSLNRAQSWL